MNSNAPNKEPVTKLKDVSVMKVILEKIVKSKNQIA